MWGEESFGRRRRQEGKKTSFDSIYTTHGYLKSLNKIACVMTRDCTLLAHYSCCIGVSHLDKQQPHPFLKSSSTSESVSCFCLRHFWFYYNNVDGTIPVRRTLKMRFISAGVWICSILFTPVKISFQKISQSLCTLLAQVPYFPLLFIFWDLSEQRWCAEETIHVKVSLFLRCIPTCWIFKSESFYEDTAGVPHRGFTSVGGPNKTGGQETQTHFPIPARPEYDLISATASDHSKDLWYAQWCANSWWVCVRKTQLSQNNNSDVLNTSNSLDYGRQHTE